MKNICVFCGSRKGVIPEYEHAAIELGKTIVSKGYGLVYGGGNVGLMGVIADAVLDAGGEVHGVIPQSLIDMEVAHTGLTKQYVVKSMHERKDLMYSLSEAFIAMPGGMGTLDEFCEILTWAQLGFHRKSISFLNTEGYFDLLLQHFERSVDEGFVSQEILDGIIVKNDVEDLIQSLKYLMTE